MDATTEHPMSRLQGFREAGTVNSIQLDVDELVEGLQKLAGRDEANLARRNRNTKWLQRCRDRAEGFDVAQDISDTSLKRISYVHVNAIKTLIF